MKRSRKAREREETERWWKRRDTIVSGIVFFLFAVMLVGLLVTSGRWLNSGPPFRKRYEGRIVDKSATFVETQQGSRVRFRLLVKEKGDAQPFLVAVNREDYERAEVGMHIRSTDEGLQLSWDEPGESTRAPAESR
jgi:hypothetical protein